MIDASLQSELDGLNDTLGEYLQFTRKTRAEALEHQANKLRWTVYRGFRKIRTSRGQVREEARRRGWRTEVRASVRKKVDEELGARTSKTVTVAGRRVKLNRQALAVHRELGVRERGSGYLGVSWLFRGWRRMRDPRTGRFFAKGRAGGRLAAVEISTTSEPPRITIENRVPGVAIVEDDRRIVAHAVRTVNEDIQEYLLKRQVRELEKSLRRNVK